MDEELKVRKTPKGDMLPWNDELDSPIWMDVEIPSRTARQPRVYAAGDLRANENIGLSVMTTVRPKLVCFGLFSVLIGIFFSFLFDPAVRTGAQSLVREDSCREPHLG